MPGTALGPVVRHLQHLADSRAGGLTDAELLRLFVASRDEAAFATLVRRHGRLVHSVCQHVLRQEADVEDAVQAAFLVLARRASTIRKQDALASWLYGVAYRTAMNAKKSIARRRSQRPPPAPRPTAQPVTEAALHELQALLDHEVQRLPARCRAPFLLCCLEGRSRAEAARELGWKEGTVAGRVAEARKLLRDRLARRGIALSAALCAVAISPGALVSAASISRILELAANAPGTAASPPAVLAESVLRATGPAKRNPLASMFVALALMGAGVGFGLSSTPSDEPAPERDEGPLAFAGGGTLEQPATDMLARAPRPEPDESRSSSSDTFGDPLPSRATRRIGTLRFRPGNYSRIRSFQFSPDGKTLVSFGDQTCVWEFATGKLLRRFPREARALAPDGKSLAVCDKAIRFQELSSGREIRELRGSAGLTEPLAFSPDGRLLAACSQGTIVLFDLASGNEVSRIASNNNGFFALKFSPDGTMLAGGGGGYANDHIGQWRDGSLYLFDVASSKETHRLQGLFVDHFLFSPDSTILAIGCDHGKIRLWDAITGKQLRDLTGASGDVNAFAFSPDGKLLVSAETSGQGPEMTICLRDMHWGDGQLPMKRWARKVWNPGAGQLTFSPDGKTVVASGGGIIHRLDVATGEELGAGSVPAAVDFHWYNAGAQLAASPAGPTIAIAGHDLRLWDLSAGQELGVLPAPSAYPVCLAFSPDGRTLIAHSGSKAVCSWDAKSLKPARQFEGNWRYALIGFSADGAPVAAQSTQGMDQSLPGLNLRLWDIASGKEQPRLVMQDETYKYGSSSGVAFSPDGRMLAATGRVSAGKAARECVCLWQADASKGFSGPGRALEFTPTTGLPSGGQPIGAGRLVFSPDGRMLAITKPRAIVPIWDTLTRRFRRQLEGFEQSLDVAFSPDGRTLASANDDGSVRLYDLDTGKERARLTGHRGPVRAVTFLADGHTLVSASEDTTALVWNVAALIRYERATRLTPAEWDTLWTDLASEAADKAWQAIGRLSADPTTPSILKERLHQARTADSAQPNNGTVSGERLRELRAVEVLERQATPEARTLLDSLANGTPDARLTQEAKAAWNRVAKRSAP